MTLHRLLARLDYEPGQLHRRCNKTFLYSGFRNPKTLKAKREKIDILTEAEGQTKLNVHRELTENDNQAMSGQTKK